MKKLCTIFILFFFTASLLQAQESSESTGKKIGTMISDAIGALLPGADALIKLIWPSNRKRDDDAKKDEVKNMIENAKDKIKKEMKEKAKEKFKDLSLIIEELTTLDAGILPALNAHLTCNEILDILRVTTTKPKPIDTHWEYIKGFQTQLNKIAIKAVRNSDLEGDLLRIRETNKSTIAIIDKNYPPKKITSFDDNQKNQLYSELRRLQTGYFDFLLKSTGTFKTFKNEYSDAYFKLVGDHYRSPSGTSLLYIEPQVEYKITLETIMEKYKKK